MSESQILLESLKELTHEIRELKLAITAFHKFDEKMETARLERDRSLLDVRNFLSKRKNATKDKVLSRQCRDEKIGIGNKRLSDSDASKQVQNAC